MRSCESKIFKTVKVSTSLNQCKFSTTRYEIACDECGNSEHAHATCKWKLIDAANVNVRQKLFWREISFWSIPVHFNISKYQNWFFIWFVSSRDSKCHSLSVQHADYHSIFRNCLRLFLGHPKADICTLIKTFLTFLIPKIPTSASNYIRLHLQQRTTIFCKVQWMVLLWSPKHAYSFRPNVSSAFSWGSLSRHDSFRNSRTHSIVSTSAHYGC